jgi:hypothetical protein
VTVASLNYTFWFKEHVGSLSHVVCVRMKLRSTALEASHTYTSVVYRLSTAGSQPLATDFVIILLKWTVICHFNSSKCVRNYGIKFLVVNPEKLDEQSCCDRCVPNTL